MALKTPSGVSSMVTVSAGSFFNLVEASTTEERVDSFDAVELLVLSLEAVEVLEMVLLLLVW